MTYRRTSLAAITAAAILITSAGCGESEAPRANPVPPVNLTPTATPTANPSATATPTISGNAPLTCPETMDVIAATAAVLNEQGTIAPNVCAYRSSNTSATGSIQSEDWFGSKSLKNYRATMRSAKGKVNGIRTKVVDRPDFDTRAFLLTFAGGPSGAITSLVIPRPGGQFAVVSASRVKDGKFETDLKLTESLARAFLGSATV